MTLTTIQIRRKGLITLPAVLRRKYNVDEGDVYSLLDLGDGSLLLMPGTSRVAQSGDEVARLLSEKDVTLDELLIALEDERAAYYQEHYVQT